MKYSTYISITLLIIGLFSCNDDNQEISLNTGQIEIKVQPGKENQVAFIAITGIITIDWGDGHVETYTPNGNYQRFSHQYDNQNLYTIYLDSEKLIEFRTEMELFTADDDRRTWGNFRELRFGEMNELDKINIYHQPLTILEIEKANALTIISCGNNQITSLDLNGLNALERLDCSGNQLTSLNLTGLASLKELSCSNNQLTSLNLTGLTALEGIFCVENQLSSLDLSGCIFLRHLDCSRNQLVSLDVRDLNYLLELLCFSNKLTYNALNELFEGLPNRLESYGILLIDNNPGFDECNRDIAINKGWTFLRLQ